MEDNLIGTTLACLASQFCSELGQAQPQLGPAQPQLVFCIYSSLLRARKIYYSSLTWSFPFLWCFPYCMHMCVNTWWRRGTTDRTSELERSVLCKPIFPGNTSIHLGHEVIKPTGCPRELFTLFGRIIICHRLVTDNFYYINLKTYISSFKMSTETLLKSAWYN